jgi:hypothetical protein
MFLGCERACWAPTAGGARRGAQRRLSSPPRLERAHKPAFGQVKEQVQRVLDQHKTKPGAHGAVAAGDANGSSGGDDAGNEDKDD